MAHRICSNEHLDSDWGAAGRCGKRLRWVIHVGLSVIASFQLIPLKAREVLDAARRRSQWPFLRFGPAERRPRRAQGRSRPAVALGLRLAPALPGCALTAPSTARESSGSDACIVSPRQL